MYDNFIIVNKSKSIIEQEPNPFEQSFAAVSPPKFEFIQVNQKWASDNCSYKSNAGTGKNAHTIGNKVGPVTRKFNIIFNIKK